MANPSAADGLKPAKRPQGEGRTFLRVALIVGLAVRLVLLTQTGGLGTGIIDEQHYVALSQNIAAGNGLAWSATEPTSIRPPLFPALLAGIWQVAGDRNLQAVRALNIVFALLTTWCVYLLGTRLYGARVGRYAAGVFWLYPTLIFFNFLILTESLFTLFLVLVVLLSVRLLEDHRVRTAVLCGLCIGLGALTRSVFWLLPLLLFPGLLLTLRGTMLKRAGLVLAVLAGYALVVTPWAIRNTRLQGVVTIVDTMGGLNFRMGNYEHTPDDRMWDAVALTGEKSWAYDLQQELQGRRITEGGKDKWAQRKAVEYMIAHPGITARRTLIRFADFWGLEREFLAGVQQDMYAPPLWFVGLVAMSSMLAYVVVALAGAAGMWLTPPADFRLRLIVLPPFLTILGVHMLAFGHSRYHLPLVPILIVHAVPLLLTLRQALRSEQRRVFLVGATASMVVLLSVWLRQILIVDWPRIRALLEHV